MIPDNHGLDVIIPLIPFVILWAVYTAIRRCKHRTNVQRLLRGRDKL